MLRHLALICSVWLTITTVQAADPAKVSKELALLPNDVAMMATVDLDAVRKHPMYPNFVKGLQSTPLSEELKKLTSLTFEDLKRYTILIPIPEIPPGQRRVPPPEPIMVFTTHKPIDQTSVLKTGAYIANDDFKKLMEEYRKRAVPLAPQVPPLPKKGAKIVQAVPAPPPPPKKGALPPKPNARPVPPAETIAPPVVKLGADYYASRNQFTLAFLDEHTLVLAPFPRMLMRDQLPPNPKDRLKSLEDKGTLTPAIELANQKSMVFALNMKAVRLIAEAEAPPDEILPMLKADQAVGYAELLSDQLNVHFSLGFAGKQWAADAEETAKGLKVLAELAITDDVNRAKKREGEISWKDQFQSLVLQFAKNTQIKQEGNDVSASTHLALDDHVKKLLEEFPKHASDSSRMTKSANNLKQIAIALHNYHDIHGQMPTNIYSKDGKPLLSWRVQLLPHLEESTLYNEFKMDEPWDSENNKKLIEKMPKLFALPDVKTKPGMTYYRSFISSKETAGKGVSSIMVEGGAKRTFAYITDGTSNSFFCAEAAEPCVWSKPDDLVFDPDNAPPKLGDQLFKGRFQVVFLDGSVRTFNTSIKDQTLKAYITINGGEVINDE